ncbi:hypothetical protein JKY72_00120 [Candidatus Gracilibacteria bacterium]|nr:hypothetical protein [Candidatus Gracilibacteria bacterium]
MATSNFPRFGSLFKGALKSVFNNLGVYLPIVLLFSVLTVVFIFGLGYLGLEELPKEPGNFEEVSMLFKELLTPQIILIALTYIVLTVLLNVFFPLAILKAHQQQEKHASEAIEWAAKNLWNGVVVGFLQFWYAFWKAVWPAVVLGLVWLATNYFGVAWGNLRFVFAILVIPVVINAVYFMVKRGIEATFSVVALVDDGNKGWSAVNKSVSVAKGNLGHIFVTMLLAGIILSLLTIPFAFITSFLGESGPSVFAGVAIEFLLGTFITAIFTVLIYDIYKALK